MRGLYSRNLSRREGQRGEGGKKGGDKADRRLEERERKMRMRERHNHSHTAYNRVILGFKEREE